mmetsp:Transcript_42064/g.112134  ORF Transcript_42064/g.112134 Transcript_42064/m.112134 type:complete len:215 (-) Transcript_42064:2373-3017(-)
MGFSFVATCISTSPTDEPPPPSRAPPPPEILSSSSGIDEVRASRSFMVFALSCSRSLFCFSWSLAISAASGDAIEPRPEARFTAFSTKVVAMLSMVLDEVARVGKSSGLTLLSRISRICAKLGRFLGLTCQHHVIKSASDFGTSSGIVGRIPPTSARQIMPHGAWVVPYCRLYSERKTWSTSFSSCKKASRQMPKLYTSIFSSYFSPDTISGAV